MKPQLYPATFRTKSATLALIGILMQTSVSAPRAPHTAFHQSANWRLLVRPRPINFEQHNQHHRSFRSHSIEVYEKRNHNIVENIAQIFGMQQSKRQTSRKTDLSSSGSDSGQVIRTASRSYQESTGGSIPSSRYYTTRKDSLPMISISETGVVGDYNRYRTVALKSTLDRAVSILTNDVSNYIKSIDGGTYAGGYREGDLGENILVDGVDLGFFRIGERYKFTPNKDGIEKLDSGRSLTDEVIVEITEPMVPCASLCKLPFINDPSLVSAKERVMRCKHFIEALEKREGLRGWYAKVISGGLVQVGDSISFSLA